MLALLQMPFTDVKLFRQERLPDREGNQRSRRKYSTVDRSWQEEVEVEGIEEARAVQTARHHDYVLCISTIFGHFCDIRLCSSIFKGGWGNNRPSSVGGLHRINESRHHNSHGIFIGQVRTETTGVLLGVRDVC